MTPAVPVTQEHVRQAHALYCDLTGQNLQLRYDREREWFELLRSGFTLEDVRRVVEYLQREIRHDRRNVGALKLSNLLRTDQFEEDLNISRVRLHSPARTRTQEKPPMEPPAMNPETLARKRQEVIQRLARFRSTL